jgi:hypothetical protein
MGGGYEEERVALLTRTEYRRPPDYSDHRCRSRPLRLSRPGRYLTGRPDLTLCVFAFTELVLWSLGLDNTSIRHCRIDIRFLNCAVLSMFLDHTHRSIQWNFAYSGPSSQSMTHLMCVKWNGFLVFAALLSWLSTAISFW